MALTPGTRLGPYEILSPLGAGGMGEVYLARDTRLDREVAVKVLPQHLAGAPEVRARFEREARAVSSLNHPNICILHDVGHENGVDFLVMERLDGETLASRLERGALPIDDVLRIGTQIADALDRAHRTGLVHRDLKPGNVMLTKGGAKLLDFGLARPTVAAASGSSLSISPTMSRPLTAEGSIVGTFQYMAPEQLEGAEADARTDIWALGLVLYEMATGKRAFEGKSQAALIAAVLERKPEPISSVLPLVPPALSRLVEACMAKDPEERIQTAHDVKLQLQWIAEGGSKAGVPAPVAARRRSREQLAWIVAGVAVFAAAGLGAYSFTRPQPDARTIRFTLLPPPGHTDSHWPRVSPDGRQIAFISTDTTGSQQIWVRPIDSFEARPLAGTEGAGRPFWSPDSRFLGFVADGKLKKAPVAGGPTTLVSDTPGRFDGTWGVQDMILLDAGPTDTLLAVSASGGVTRPATTLDRSLREISHAWPFFLPDGEHFVFIADHAGDGTSEPSIKLGRLGSLESFELGKSDSRIEFLPPSHLVFVRDGTLVAQRLDLGRKALVGDPIPISDNVLTSRNEGDFSASASGVLAFAKSSFGASSVLALVDRSGTRLREIGEPRAFRDLHLSPDGRRLAVGIEDARSGHEDVWVYDVERNIGSRLTFNDADDIWPVWSADGNRVYFSSDRTGMFRMYSKAGSGVGEEDSLVQSVNFAEAAVSISPDGRWLVSTVLAGTSSWDLWVRPTDGSAPPKLFLGDPHVERDGTISPDGRWLAYRSNETGRSEVYVRSFPDGASKYQISNAGGFDPLWRSDGRELIYNQVGGAIMAVPLTPGEDFVAGTPVQLFQTSLVSTGFGERRWTMTPDAQRFVLNTSTGDVTRTEFAVITNIPTELGLEK